MGSVREGLARTGFPSVMRAMVLACALGAGLARAQEEPPPPTLHAIVLAEDATGEGAARKQEEYARRASEAPALNVGKGYPRLFTADELVGLPRARHYVVLGFCEELAEARDAARQVKRIAPEVQVAATPTYAAESCPGRPAPDSPWELHSRAWVGMRGPEARRVWFIHRHRHPPASCPHAARWRVEVREGVRALTQQVLDTVCGAPNAEGGARASSEWRIEPLTLDDATVLHVVEKHDAGGGAQASHALWGYGCGRLVKQALGTSVDRAGGEMLEVEARAGEQGRPSVVRVIRSKGAATHEVPSVEEHIWSSKQCLFERKALTLSAE